MCFCWKFIIESVKLITWNSSGYLENLNNIALLIYLSLKVISTRENNSFKKSRTSQKTIIFRCLWKYEFLLSDWRRRARKESLKIIETNTTANSGSTNKCQFDQCPTAITSTTTTWLTQRQKKTELLRSKCWCSIISNWTASISFGIAFFLPFISKFSRKEILKNFTTEFGFKSLILALN